MAKITETFIKPEIHRPTQKADYTISDIEESDLDASVQAKLNTAAVVAGTIIYGGSTPSTIPTTPPSILGGYHPNNIP